MRSRPGSLRFHSGDWFLETETRQIVRAGQEVHVSPKAFDLLTALLVDRPRVLSKAELRQRIWPDTYVTETSLANLVAELRAALGDEVGRPRYIRTVHRHGYAFCGTATNEAEASRQTASGRRVLLVLRDREIALEPGTHVLGRDPDAAVWIDSAHVSRHHARLVVSAAGASIEDLGSKNGTFVNRLRVAGVQRLSDRDEIDLGPERLVLRFLAEAASTLTQPD
jgi:DNA-binding winged helix-turn-helix (wHTH) protein